MLICLTAQGGISCAYAQEKKKLLWVNKFSNQVAVADALSFAQCKSKYMQTHQLLKTQTLSLPV